MVKLRLGEAMGRLVDSLSSYDTNVMLAAIISLLVVILFVLLLHLFAKWFLSQASHRRLPPTSLFVPSHRLTPTRLYHSFSPTSSKGLEAATIAAIPLFVYRSLEFQSQGMKECVICLSAFEENEVGRCLSRCRHGFHVECIDMWLRSHSDCPICRAPAAGNRIEVGFADEVRETRVTPEAVLETVMIVFEHANGDSRVPADARCSTEIRSPTASSPSTSSNSLGCSFKRMLSRNRSETKICPE